MPSQLPLIFVVDDDADLRTCMLDVLSLSGYQVRTWPGAHGAQAQICHALPALVITDLRMEHRTAGLDVVRDLRADPVTAAIPAILYSSALQTLDVQRERLRAAGVGLLPKPFTLDALLALVAGMVGAGGLL